MSLFLFNYGAHEFFGLARGYGMATAFVLAGIYFYKEWSIKLEQYLYLTLTYLLLLVGCFSNTVVLLILATILIDSFIRLIRSGHLFKYLKGSWLLLIPIAAGILLNINYHFLVSAEGLPLYGGDGTFLKDFIISLFEVYGFGNYSALVSIMVLLIVLSGFIFRCKELLKNNLWIISILYSLLLILLTKITNQLWLTGRTLLPVIPLFIFSYIEIHERVFIKGSRKIINLLIICIILIFFIMNLNVVRTRDWNNYYTLRNKVYELYRIGKQDELEDLREKYNNSPAIRFYEDKIDIYGL
jgi:hypothetical protein